MQHKIYVQAIADWSDSYCGEPFHAVLTDPPYHLEEMNKRFRSPSAKPPKGGDKFTRLSKGFMGQDWDGGDVAFLPETWEQITRHVYPGGWGFAFSSTRTLHRMAGAIEAAGLEIQGMIAWMFASGFPKATRIDVQIDRKRGNVRPVLGVARHVPKFNAAAHGYRQKDNGFNSRSRTHYDLTAAGSNESASWEGHRYGVQAINPAMEPILVFRKRYKGKPIDSILATGAGALNIDAARIPMDDPYIRKNSKGQNGMFNASGGTVESHPGGYWPKNVMLSHSPDCSASMCVPGCPVLVLEQSSPGTSASFCVLDDFYDRVDYPPFIYASKPSKKEKDAGLQDSPPGTVTDGRKKDVDNPFQRGKTERHNLHPTVKPISLARQLAALLLPPATVPNRSLLVPFSGSGTEMIGAGLAGWEYVHGVEFKQSYADIAHARIAHWCDIFHYADVLADE